MVSLKCLGLCEVVLGRFGAIVIRDDSCAGRPSRLMITEVVNFPRGLVPLLRCLSLFLHVQRHCAIINRLP